MRKSKLMMQFYDIVGLGSQSSFKMNHISRLRECLQGATFDGRYWRKKLKTQRNITQWFSYVKIISNIKFLTNYTRFSTDAKIFESKEPEKNSYALKGQHALLNGLEFAIIS